MPPYSSCGTIRTTIRFGDNPAVEDIKFTPDAEHFIKHKDRRYAAFVPKPPKSIDGRLLPLTEDEGEKGRYCVSLHFPDRLETPLATVAAIAAATQAKVDVEIDAPPQTTSDDAWEVINITIPAK